VPSARCNYSAAAINPASPAFFNLILDSGAKSFQRSWGGRITVKRDQAPWEMGEKIDRRKKHRSQTHIHRGALDYYNTKGAAETSGLSPCRSKRSAAHQNSLVSCAWCVPLISAMDDGGTSFSSSMRGASPCRETFIAVFGTSRGRGIFGGLVASQPFSASYRFPIGARRGRRKPDGALFTLACLLLNRRYPRSWAGRETELAPPRGLA